jgi:hypothetical protein
MTNETLIRLKQMSRERKEEGFQELLQRHNIAPVPATVPRGGAPIPPVNDSPGVVTYPLRLHFRWRDTGGRKPN